jgi:hypothetical protein
MLLNKSCGSHIRCHLKNCALQKQQFDRWNYSPKKFVCPNIAWVDSELWASLVDVLRTEAVALFFIRVRFTHPHKKNFQIRY